MSHHSYCRRYSMQRNRQDLRHGQLARRPMNCARTSAQPYTNLVALSKLVLGEADAQCASPY